MWSENGGEVDGTSRCRDIGADALMERDHELRAALCGIEAVALALHEQRDRLPYGEVDQLAQTIAAEARRLQLLVAPQPPSRETFELAEVIRPAVVMARSLGVVVRDAVPAGLVAEGSSDAVVEVLFALLDNARVHAAGSPVDIRATERADSVKIFVEDRGPGMDRSTRETMFERGRHGRYSSGSGLGLFIARRLMAQQGGTLTAQPRRGGGESFALTLPRAQTTATEMSAPARFDRVRLR
jgi:signal transduction histidine kinase